MYLVELQTMVPEDWAKFYYFINTEKAPTRVFSLLKTKQVLIQG